METGRQGSRNSGDQKNHYVTRAGGWREQSRTGAPRKNQNQKKKIRKKRVKKSLVSSSFRNWETVREIIRVFFCVAWFVWVCVCVWGRLCEENWWTEVGGGGEEIDKKKRRAALLACPRRAKRKTNEKQNKRKATNRRKTGTWISIRNPRVWFVSVKASTRLKTKHHTTSLPDT